MISRRALFAAPVLVAPLLAAAGPSLPLAARPIERSEKWWQARHAEKLAELRTTKPELIWLGDSITENFERSDAQPWAKFRAVWDHYYAPRRAVNLGFKGDATSHLLWRITHGELGGIAPKAAVMLIGANNMGRLHWSAEDTVTGIDTILAETRRRLPTTRILLLSVLPSDRSEWASATTVQINTMLARRPKIDSVIFQDVTSLYMRDGRFDHAMFYDPLLSPPEPALHPTAEGMGRLAAAIEPTLSGLMRG